MHPRCVLPSTQNFADKLLTRPSPSWAQDVKGGYCHARASIRPSNSFGPTSVRLCPNSILRCPNYTELSLELSICLVCSFVYNLLIVLDFAIPNYPELLDLLLVSFPLALLSRSQIPSHHSLIRAPNSHHSFVILRSLITVAHPLTR